MGYLRSRFSESMEKLAFSGAFAEKSRAFKQEMQQATSTASNKQPQQQASGWTRGLTEEKRKQLRDACDKRRELLLRNRPDLRWRPGMTPEEEKKLQDRWNFYYKWQAK